VQKLKNLACESARIYKNRQNGRVPFESLKQAVEHAQQIVATSSKITVLTGAGISTDSGIPDFRGPNGLWTKNPDSERAATLAFYLQDEELRQRSWQNRLKWINNNPQPNDGHRALIALERRNALLAIVTQNVDELHQRAGHDPEKVFEVHGTLHRTCCWGCKDRRPMTEALARVQAGDVDPKCQLCGGILKSDTILFGQSLDQVVMQKAMQVSSECDVFLAIGTSLSVFPACNTLPRAKSCGAKIVIVNGQPTEMDMYADAVVNAPIAEVLPQICGVVKS
jgi:NAD-dependent deacetylase